MQPARIEPTAGQESVWDYPRPPALVPDDRRVTIELAGVAIADTMHALRVLETSSPPTFYLPLTDVRRDLLRPANGTSFCEWKGVAAYLDIVVGERVSSEAGWYYPDPSARYAALADHVAFYAGRVDRATVGGIMVTPQPGGYYGGWITPDVVGPFKGAPGTHRW